MKEKSYDTGFVPEAPGSCILRRRYYDAERGVGGQEWIIPWKPMNLTAEDMKTCIYPIVQAVEIKS